MRHNNPGKYWSLLNIHRNVDEVFFCKCIKIKNHLVYNSFLSDKSIIADEKKKKKNWSNERMRIENNKDLLANSLAQQALTHRTLINRQKISVAPSTLPLTFLSQRLHWVNRICPVERLLSALICLFNVFSRVHSFSFALAYTWNTCGNYPSISTFVYSLFELTRVHII